MKVLIPRGCGIASSAFPLLEAKTGLEIIGGQFGALSVKRIWSGNVDPPGRKQPAN
jgi:hypothetical protein